jgi:hypothetical protein
LERSLSEQHTIASIGRETRFARGGDTKRDCRAAVLSGLLTVTLSGVKINESTGGKGEEGYIGLQNHLPTDKVWFRNVRVLELI